MKVHHILSVFSASDNDIAIITIIEKYNWQIVSKLWKTNSTYIFHSRPSRNKFGKEICRIIIVINRIIPQRYETESVYKMITTFDQTKNNLHSQSNVLRSEISNLAPRSGRVYYPRLFVKYISFGVAIAEILNQKLVTSSRFIL